MSDKDCLFCKIIAGEIPSEKVYEDDATYAFKDINPKAKVHVLIVPRKHYANVAELAKEDPAQLAHMAEVAQKIADQEFHGAFRLIFNTGIDAVQWAIEAEKRGAGAILLTSMDCDGVKNGYDLELTRSVSEAVGIPVIASGGAGSMPHFYDALTDGKADAVLAASLFHFGEITIPQLKEYLSGRGIPVRK